MEPIVFVLVVDVHSTPAQTHEKSCPELGSHGAILARNASSCSQIAAACAPSSIKHVLGTEHQT